MIAIETLPTATPTRHWLIVVVVTLLHIWLALSHLIWRLPATVLSLKINYILLLQIPLLNHKLLLSLLVLLHPSLLQRLLRHDVDRFADVDLLEHGDGGGFGQYEGVWADLGFYALGGVLAWAWTLWALLWVGSSFELGALCLCVVAVVRLVGFLSYDCWVRWKSTAFYFQLFMLKCLCLIYLRAKPFIVFIRFLLLLEVTFWAQVRNRWTVF